MVDQDTVRSLYFPIYEQLCSLYNEYLCFLLAGEEDLSGIWGLGDL